MWVCDCLCRQMLGNWTSEEDFAISPSSRTCASSTDVCVGHEEDESEFLDLGRTVILRMIDTMRPW